MSDATQRLDHGVFGNGRVLGLVSPTSAIEWLCMPRFDSPSVYARLLDAERGGVFRVLRGGREVRGDIAYFANTNVLRTRFTGDDGTYDVIDFAPRIARGITVDAAIEAVRLVRPVAGNPRVSFDFDPRPDYGSIKPTLVPSGASVEVLGGTVPMHLSTNLPLAYLENRAEVALREPLYFTLGLGPARALRSIRDVERDLADTIAAWRVWSKSCALPTFAPAAVLRSALCLKLHAYEDTGAIIAATTTSIPEALGSGRTWDYRFCWLRDAAFVVEALRRLSHVYEGERFIRFLRHVAEAAPLQPLYGVGGERSLDEYVVTHLKGFGGDGPVRIGNAASTQQQNDLHGELILCLETLLRDPRVLLDEGDDYFPLVERLVEEAIKLSPLPDTSIWEFRSEPRRYTFSRAMCWAAVERGAQLAEALGHTRDASRWKDFARDELREVLARGYSVEAGCFVQSLDGEPLPDASLLLLPTLGVIDARDPRFLSTLDVYERRLVRSGLMLRYANDDFGETTSAFTLCSFWWAEALALAGRLDEAIVVFRRLLGYANPLGLFSEDVDPVTGQLLGNFPQAYTHVGLVHAAMTISELLEAREGRVRAWT